MRVTEAGLPGLLILEPEVHSDARGVFFESYNRRQFEALTGVRAEFAQDNHSHSARNVLRGLHYQIRQPQGKLVRVVAGEAYDVAVDIRRSSPAYGKWVAARLSAENKKIMWIPPGFAHGFLALSAQTVCLYKVTDYRAPEHERCILWNDPDLAIGWPLQGAPLVSARDAAGTPLSKAEVFE